MNYQRIYDQIIYRAQTRVLTGYVERHHIVPRAHGGSNHADNIVCLQAREHYLAHWLLFKIYGDKAMAKAFRLLCDTNKCRRGRTYEEAKIVYAAHMMGDNNVAKSEAVRSKIRLGLAKNHPFRGKQRPNHSALMKQKEQWAGANNPWYGTGARQIGSKNHMAKSVVGKKGDVVNEWDTLKQAADDIGVTIQAISQALKKNRLTKGWNMEYKQ